MKHAEDTEVSKDYLSENLIYNFIQKKKGDAEIVVYITGMPINDDDNSISNKVCGVASNIGIDDKRFFALINGNCLESTTTLAHEIGHLLGTRHEIWADSTSATPGAHAWSWKIPITNPKVPFWQQISWPFIAPPTDHFSEVRVGTVMCDDCKFRIPWFSDYHDTGDCDRDISIGNHDSANNKVQIPDYIFKKYIGASSDYRNNGHNANTVNDEACLNSNSTYDVQSKLRCASQTAYQDNSINTIDKNPIQLCSALPETISTTPLATDYFITFPIGVAEIDSTSAKIIQTIAADLINLNATKIMISGYADRSGKPDNNLILSYKRAKNFAEILDNELTKLHYIDLEIEYCVHGHLRPLLNDTIDDLDRRAEVIVLESSARKLPLKQQVKRSASSPVAQTALK